jgi:Bacterial archaeo-eukaryotic release factor family 10
MENPERDRLLRQLSEWRPPGGVLSVYVDTDPADRGRGWWIALRDRLRGLARDVGPHEERRGFEAAAGRVLERFPEDGPPPRGRGHAGFVEVAARPAEIWRSMQTPPRRLEVVHSPRAYLRPLIELFDEGPYVGVALVSAERVRLLEWSMGAIRELEDWELVLWSRDWRERKAERSRSGQHEGASASGRDQFGQRLDANRRRFLREVGGTIGEELEGRGWRHLIAFGAEQHVEAMASGLAAQARRLHAVPHDLISAPDSDVAARVGTVVQELNRRRELAIVRDLAEAIGRGAGAALGPAEVLETLAQGRVRHLIFDADRDYAGEPLEAEAAGDGEDELPAAERMIELAVATSAEITALEGEPATALAKHDGVAALLRY